jgi:DNA topoisomerase-3
MEIAEKLYTKGLISYPRTETNFFTDAINLQSLIGKQTTSSDWGAYAQSLLSDGKFRSPGVGKSDDKSHPPIHPIKCQERAGMDNDEWRVYELVVRHFLAVCSDHARGRETVNVARFGEGGHAYVGKGLVIDERNFLDIFIYRNWTGNLFAKYDTNENFCPDELNIDEKWTQPPPLLSEKDLLTKMDKAHIGTDATMATHIKTI